MKLFFIRHGQSENNALWAETHSNLGRVSDPKLTLIGKKQIENAAQFLEKTLRQNNSDYKDPSYINEGEDIFIYCSLMERAIQSGMIIANRLSLPIYAHLDIHENGGLYLEDHATQEKTGTSGRSVIDLKKIYPSLTLPQGINPSGWWNRPFEERETRRIRAKKALNDLKIQFGNTNTTVIFISHGGFYNYFLRAIFELRDDTEIWFDLFNAAISLIEFSDNSVNLVYCNRFDFLPRKLTT
jgi:2,3-bisphosphoglycerate-dependent phosphoglycerate mutase